MLAALLVLCVSPRLRGPIDLRWDASVYYVLGTALYEGKGYRLLNEPGQILETQYPPLLPLSIAGVELLTRSRDPLEVGRSLRRGYLGLFAVYVFASYAMARRFVSPGAALTVGLFCVVNAYAHFMSDQAAADLPFAAATAVFLLSATARPGRKPQTIATVSCVAAYLLRTAGLALIMAWVGDALFKRRLRAALLRLAIGLVPVAAWNGYIARVERSPEYARTAYSYQRAAFLFYNVSYKTNAILRDTYRPEAGKISVHDFLKQRLLQNVAAFPAAMGEAITSQRPFWQLNGMTAAERTGIHVQLPNILYETILALIGGTAIYGGFLFLCRGQTLVFLVMFFSAVLICATPWPWQMVRYLMPLNPLIALFFVEALLTIKRFLSPMMPAKLVWAPAAAVGLTFAFLGGQASSTLVRFYRDYHSPAVSFGSGEGSPKYKLFFYEPSYSALDRALAWLEKQAKPADILALSMPQWAYIRTGFRSVMVPFERDPLVVQRDLDSVPVTFFIVQRAGPFDMEPYVAAVVGSPPAWAKAYSDASQYVRVYRRLR